MLDPSLKSSSSSFSASKSYKPRHNGSRPVLPVEPFEIALKYNIIISTLSNKRDLRARINYCE